jgi:hypothetical protein
MTSASNAPSGAIRTQDARTRTTSASASASASAEHFTEAKNGFKSSEFYAMLALVVAILVATYVNNDDSLGHSQGWLYAAIVAAAYILSRGLAKLGVREPDRDD